MVVAEAPFGQSCRSQIGAICRQSWSIAGPFVQAHPSFFTALSEVGTGRRAAVVQARATASAQPKRCGTFSAIRRHISISLAAAARRISKAVMVSFLRL